MMKDSEDNSISYNGVRKLSYLPNANCPGLSGTVRDSPREVGAEIVPQGRVILLVVSQY